MSNQEIKDLSISVLNMKLTNMGVSLDSIEHPKHYYEKMYLDKSNAKNKVTRNDTSFYHEHIINRKRERTSSKKTKINQKKISEEKEKLLEEEENENIAYSKKRKSVKSHNRNIKNKKQKDSSSGIKVTRLIMSKNKNNNHDIKNEKRMLRSNNNIGENFEQSKNQRTKRNILRNKKMKIDNDFIYYNDGIKNLKTKSKSK